MSSLKIKKGDNVKVIAGKYKNFTGKVLRVDPKENKVVVEGVAMVKKHVKANAGNQQGGIVSTEAPIDISNVMLLVDDKPTRVGFKVEEVNGKVVKHRVAKATGKVID